MEKVKDCIGDNGWINSTNNLLCKEFEKDITLPDSNIHKGRYYTYA